MKTTKTTQAAEAMKPNKILSGVLGAAMAAGGVGMQLANPAAVGAATQTAEGLLDATHVAFGTAPSAREGTWLRGPVAGDFVPVAADDVQGEFSFTQEGISPNDDLFNIFGTTITSMCSKPIFEADDAVEGQANFYLNVGGHMMKSFSVDVSKLAKTSSKTMIIVCSCATGRPFAQVEVTGVPLSAIVEMADLDPDVNTVTAIGADGFGMPLPLRYALERDALLVYRVNGEDLATAGEDGSSLQLYLPSTVARYFTRNVADLQFTAEASEPEVMDVDGAWRNKIDLMNYADGCVFKAGQQIVFEGVADDLGSPIQTIELSFDGGQTWTACETSGAVAERWVNWQFATVIDEPGSYRLDARARTADGAVSPLEATLEFHVY